ncbi:hypothetical protein [Aminicella lysinilytica]|nr:hypothetical protein [Aminicella lysinilytica]
MTEVTPVAVTADSVKLTEVTPATVTADSVILTFSAGAKYYVLMV